MKIKLMSVAITLGAFLAADAAHAATDPADACKDTKAKAAGKKASDVLKAVGKNIKKSDPIKLSASISKAQSKLTKNFVKAESKSGCTTTGDVGAIEAKVDAFAADVANDIDPPAQTCGNDIQEGTEGCDGTDDAACVGLCQPNCICPAPSCGNGVLEAGEECESPCDVGGPCGGGELCGVDCTCVPADPCTCGSPSMLSYETDFGPGLCGELRDIGDSLLLDLECGQSYVGGGLLGAAPPITPIPIGKTFYNVACCYGSTLALTATTAGETGSNKTCSSKDCTLGAPVPTLVSPSIQSVCTNDNLAADVFGSADCATGEINLTQPIVAPVFLTGDTILPNRCSAASTTPGFSCLDDSECIGGTCDNDAGSFLCSGGSNDGNPCLNQDSNCPGGTCEGVLIQPCAICNPVTNVCNGGPNQGLPCTPGTGSLADEYPTSHDCPVDSLLELPASEQPYELSSGMPSKEAPDGQFCGWCRDASIENTGCFEGNPTPGCPPSSIIDCGDGTGGTECGQGNAVACNSAADCYAPYESCVQRDAGASNQPTATKYTQTGTPAGNITDGAEHAATIVSVHCVPPTFEPNTDTAADFPGPGSVSLPGTVQLLP
jgi:hypothetical protein